MSLQTNDVRILNEIVDNRKKIGVEVTYSESFDNIPFEKAILFLKEQYTNEYSNSFSNNKFIFDEFINMTSNIKSNIDKDSLYSVNVSLNHFSSEYQEFKEMLFNYKFLKQDLYAISKRHLEFWKEFAIKNNTNIEDEIISCEQVLNDFNTSSLKTKVTESVEFLFRLKNNFYTLEIIQKDCFNNDPEALELLKSTLENIKKLYQQDNPITRNDSFNDLIETDNFLSVMNKLDEKFASIYKKIIKNNDLKSYSFAESYFKSTKNKTPLDFLTQKSIENEINVNSKNIKSIIIFNDSSMIFTKKDDSVFIPFSQKDAKIKIKQVFREHISHNLRKNPIIMKEMINILEDSNYEEMEFAMSAIDKIINNQNIFKSSNFEIVQEMRNSLKPQYGLTEYDLFGAGPIEIFDDKLNKTVDEHNFKQYAHSITSNKYRNLYDEESYIILKELYNLKIDASLLQGNIGKKLALHKNPEDFNSALNKFLDSFNNFEVEYIENKCKENNAKIIFNKDNKIIVHIDNYNQSKNLGSNSWCISRNESYFNSYTSDGKNQYFIFDLSKPSRDNMSLIGITLNKDRELHTSHSKDDTLLRISNETIKILVNQIKDLTINLDHRKKEKIKIENI